MSDGPWQVGDPEPSSVRVVLDGTEDRPADIGSSDVWSLTISGRWKGRKDGRWQYLLWAELVDQWGPVMLP